MFLTFGHSTLMLDAAAKQLRDEGVQQLIDTRSHPVSNAQPQWNKSNIEANISKYGGISYLWLPNLGGWSTELDPALTRDEIEFFETETEVKVSSYLGGYFPKAQIGAKLKKTYQEPGWTNRGLRDYSYFMTTEAFRLGVEELLYQESIFGTVAFMCCELLWWKCHRSMIADYLVHLGHDVYHMQPQFKNHKLALGNRLERYEPYVHQTWEKWQTAP